MWSSIRNKVVLFTIVPITVLYSAIFAFHIFETLDTSRSAVEESMDEQASHFAGLLNNQLKYIESYSGFLARSTHNAEVGSARFLEQLRFILGGNEALHAVMVGKPGQSRLFQFQDDSVRSVEWLDDRTGLLSVNAWGWSLPFESPLTGETVVSFQIPGLEDTYFLVRIKSLMNLLQERNPREFRFVIVDRESRFVHSDMRTTKPDSSLYETAVRLQSDTLRRLVTGPIHEGQKGMEVVFFRDWPTWYFASPVPEAGWVLLTHIRETYALAPAWNAAYSSGLLMLIVLLVVSAGVLKISGFITGPLVKLTKAVDHLGDGHWHLPFEQVSKDETGRLASSITALAQRLEERDAALKELRVSNISRIAERLRGHYFYYTLDNKGKLTFVSASVIHILGYSPEDFKKKVEEIFYSGEQHREIREIIRGALGGQLQDDAIQIELPHRDGETRIIEIINVPVIEPGGRVSGIEGMGHDVTELIADTKKFRGLLESAPDATVITDHDELIIMVNARAEGLFGYGRQELIGKPLAMLGKKRSGHLLPKNDNSSWPGLMQQGFETVCRRQDGHCFPAEVTSNPLDMATGTLITIAVRDITDRKNTEKDLRLARDRARAADQAKSQFLSNMSHELRTPLNGILGHVQLLLRTSSIKGNERESLETVEDCGQHLLLIINDILDLTKIETAGSHVQFQPVRLRPVLDKVCRTLRPRAERKGLQLGLDVDDKLPSVILMDATKLRQVLLNLLGNAVKFTQQGKVQLKVLANGDQVVYIVSDTGVGIEHGEQDRIFSPFQQVEFQDHPGGTGLGLAISQRLVSALSGTLKVASSPGFGSRFYFSLPLRRAVLNEDVEASAASLDARCMHLQPGDKARVLVADDSRINRELLVRLLENAGFDTLEAINGLEAMDVVQKQQPELVLMDIRMPVMNGMEAVRKLRQQGNPVPVVAVTASVDPIQQEKLEPLGFDGYISKPFRVDDLFKKIESVLNIRFVWKEAQENSLEGVTSSPAVSHVKVLMKSLQQAAEVGDIDRVRALTRQLQEDPSCEKFVTALENLCRTFAFDQLESFCKNVVEQVATNLETDDGIEKPPSSEQ